MRGDCRLAAPVTEKRIGLNRYPGRSPMRIERAQRASEVSAVGVSDDGGGVDRCLRAMTGGEGRRPPPSTRRSTRQKTSSRTAERRLRAGHRSTAGSSVAVSLSSRLACVACRDRAHPHSDGHGSPRLRRAGAPPRALEQHGRQHARRVREQIAPVESAAEDEMPDSGAAR